MFIIDVVLESISAILVGMVVAKLFAIRSDRAVREQPGWRLVFAGTLLLFIALVFDVSDNFPALNSLVILGKTEGEAIIEKLGYFFGYLLLAGGASQWLAAIRERAALKADLASRDLTLKKMTESFRLKDDLYRSITTAAHEAIFLLDTVGRIAFCNPAAERIFGYSQEEMLGEELYCLMVPERYRESYRSGYAEFVRHGSGPVVGQTIEADACRKGGGEFPVEISISPIWYGDGWYALGVLRDITERKESEEERQRLARQLRQAQKMEAIGTLAGGIAHDFNNILTAIIGYGEMVSEELPPEHLAQEDQRQLLKAAYRARDLVKQILTFSRQSEQVLQPLQVQYIAKEALKLLRASIPSTIEIRESIDPSCPPVQAEPGQIHQVIMNLCTNAYQAMRQGGGRLSVTLGCRLLTAAELDASPDLRPGNYVILEVRDTGCGMPRQIRERIFEPYFTTKGPGEGTGLGLSLVHGIATNLGGGITVASEPGAGSTFTVYLPVTGAERVEESPADHEEPGGGNESILVVDDEEDIVFLVRRLLEKLGYRVIGHTDSVQALEHFAKDPWAIDLVITHMTMPVLAGTELSAGILRYRPGMPIILCTGFNDLINKERAKELGIREFMMKPILKEELAAAVRRALAD